MKRRMRQLCAMFLCVICVIVLAIPAQAEENQKVTVALSPDNFPYSSMRTGRMTGIYPELLALLSARTGLEFEILPCETYADYAEMKKNKVADVVFATHVDEATAGAVGYRLTKPYLTAMYSKIELRNNHSSATKVAALERPSAEATIAARYYYDDQILYCKSMEECLTALKNRECEAVIAGTYQAASLKFGDVQNRYLVKTLYDNTVSISAGVRLDCDPDLYITLEKALASVGELTKSQIVNRNTQQLSREESLTDLIYSNPVVVVGVISALFFLIMVVTFLLYRMRTISQQQKQAEEYRRFVGYVCTAVDTVTELDLTHRTMTRYSMQNGLLHEEHEDYLEDEFLLFHPDDREAMRETYSVENLMKLCRSGATSYSECRMMWNHAREYHWCNCILQGIKPTKEKPFNLLLILKDTDEVKVKEERQKKALEDAFELAKQASQAKGAFLSKMSHEIRTPLNAIIGYLSIAKDSDGKLDQILHCVDNSEIAARHLLNIINDVLDISSIESGKMKIASEEFDLKKEVTNISTIFYQNAKGKGVRFEVHLSKLTEEWVIGDSLRLNQVLMNLLSNAVKFTPVDGLVTLGIDQLRQDEKQVYIRFSVSDTGIGMSEEYMSRLFQPFEQESAATAQKYGGTGLGLSITHNLVEMMGGTMAVQSRQGEGSTFTVTMHFDRAKEHHAPTLASADYSHVRALVVDDQQDDGTYIKTMLKRCGVKSDTVTNGELALKKMRSRAGGEYSYDLCILDWNMPVMNGMEVAAKIRQEYGTELPIIIATAYDITPLMEEAKSVGVNRVVAKPLFQSTMFDLLVSTFGKYDPSSGAAAAEIRRDLTGVHVLLAEDNAMNMEIAVTVLQKAGVVVDQAVNGQEAYEKFTGAAAGTYDLILMDVQMPVLNGYEATGKIRQSDHPEAKTIPIVAMTANAFAEDVAEALSHGMNAHIAKPVNNDKLFEILNQFSKHRS